MRATPNHLPGAARPVPVLRLQGLKFVGCDLEEPSCLFELGHLQNLRELTFGCTSDIRAEDRLCFEAVVFQLCTMRCLSLEHVLFTLAGNAPGYELAVGNIQARLARCTRRWCREDVSVTITRTGSAE